MKIDVYDSYSQSAEGQLMHFDVLVAAGTSQQQAHQYGQQWLVSIGAVSTDLKLSRCNFCHSEMANPEVAQEITRNGYFILKMQGCPGV
ncbi:DUF2024 family protein [Aliamphritea ceti]|uniref:DUF2024 family protein n=1 Tax=Aliamphritea ceti TaxID=1524258 RepID=UPI0021C4A861|nr:DUF2024 family protein [Aliamphritea ceti]